MDWYNLTLADLLYITGRSLLELLRRLFGWFLLTALVVGFAGLFLQMLGELRQVLEFLT